MTDQPGDEATPRPETAPADDAPPAGAWAAGDAHGAGSDVPVTDDGVESADVDDPDDAEATSAERDQLAEAQAAIDEARRRVAEVPAEVVVTNHVMGLYELAAIHLSADQPDLRAAALAIDSVACLVDGLGDRLGPEAATMRDALGNIRLAFVEIKSRVPSPPS